MQSTFKVKKKMRGPGGFNLLPGARFEMLHGAGMYYVKRGLAVLDNKRTKTDAVDNKKAKPTTKSGTDASGSKEEPANRGG